MRRLLKFVIKGSFFLFEIVINFLILRLQSVKYINFPDIRGIIFIRNHGSITLGRDIIINCKMSANPVGGCYRTSIAVSNGATLTIGDNVGISGAAIMCNKSIFIGKNTMIGGDCRIYDTDFHSIVYRKRVSNADDSISEKPVYIGEGVFIGAGSIILKAAKIGDRSIIGAGSVVSREIPGSEIWAGNPVQFIRKLSEDESASTEANIDI